MKKCKTKEIRSMMHEVRGMIHKLQVENTNKAWFAI